MVLTGEMYGNTVRSENNSLKTIPTKVFIPLRDCNFNVRSHFCTESAC